MRPIRMDTPSRAKFWTSSVFRWLWAPLVLGLVGYGLNLAAIPIAFGLDFIMGGVLPFMALRLFGVGPAVMVSAIAGAATYTLWGHPWAMLVFTVEILFVGFLYRYRSLPFIFGTVLYWILLGAPLLWLTYGGIMGMDAQSVLSVIVKQALNGLVQVIVAEALMLPFVLSSRLCMRFGNQAVAFRELLFVALVGMAAFPVMILTTLQSSSDLRNQLKVIESALRSDAAVLGRVFQASQKQIVQEFSSEGETGNTRELLQHYPIIAAVEFKRGDGSPNFVQRPEIERSSLIKILPHTGIRATGAEGLTIQFWSTRELLEAWFRPYLDESKQVISILGPTAPQGGHVKVNNLGTGIHLLKPDMPGRSVMTEWLSSSMRLVVDDMLPGGNVVVNFDRPLRDDVLLLRARGREGMAIALLCILLIPAIALPLSAVVSSGLRRLKVHLADLPHQALTGNLRPFGSSRISEFNAVSKTADTMARTLFDQMEKTRRYQNRLEKIVTEAPVVIFVLPWNEGTAEKPTYCSPSIERILGFTQEDIYASGWWHKNIHPDDLNIVNEAMRTLAMQYDVRFRARFRHKEGHYIRVYSELHLLEGVDGDREVIGLWVDQTAEYDAEQSLIRASKLSDLGQMATGVAHELNQPLNVIDMAASNMTSRIDRGALDAAYAKSKLDRIRQQVKRAANITNHMRIFGRDSGAVPEVFSVADAINGLNILFHKELVLKNISLNISNEIPDACIKGHPGLLEQVFVNLVTNARYQILKSRDDRRPGGGPGDDYINVDVAGVADGWVRIKFLDSGGGISPDVLNRIFDPFVTSKPVGDGTGLGLSVAYGIIKDMGGCISVNNIDGGACFEIDLPLAQEASGAHEA